MLIFYTNFSKYNVKRVTNDHHVTYYVKNEFRVDSKEYLIKLEKQVEEDLLVELRQSCFREKSYSMYHFDYLYGITLI